MCGTLRECVERLEFVGAVRVGVESESCWSEWSESSWSRAVRVHV